MFDITNIKGLNGTWDKWEIFLFLICVLGLKPSTKLFTANVFMFDRVQKRWMSESSEWGWQPARSRVKPRTELSGWGSTWPTYCWAKEPRRSWRWPGSSMTPDNPALSRGRAMEVTGSLNTVSHSLVSSKNLNSIFFMLHLAWAKRAQRCIVSLLYQVSSVNSR